MGREESVNKGRHNVGDSKKRKKTSKQQVDSSKSGRRNNVAKNSQLADKKAEKNSKKNMNRALKTILIILIVALITCCAIFGSYVYRAGGNFTEAFKSLVKDVVGDQDPIFVLVLGVSEDISAELTDTIMLVGYNPDNNQAFVLSIPRDTFIGESEARAGGFDKINALYQKSPQRTIEAVENLTGVKIDHYVTIKTSVLVQIVDSLGGVSFDVPINMDYDDPTQDLHIHLKAGYQKLNGDQAEQLVRFRHNNNGTTYSASYGDNDEGRMRTQREFLKVVAQQVTQTKSIDQIKQIINAVFDNLETNITLGKAIGYAPYAIDLNVNDLQMEQLPGTPDKINSLWFFRADKEKSKELINDYIEKLGLTEEEKARYLKQSEKEQKTNNKTTEKSKNTNTNTTKKATNTTTKNTTSTTTKNTNTNTTTNTTSKKTNTNTTNNTTTNTMTNTTPNEDKHLVTEKNETTSETKPEDPKTSTESKPSEAQDNTSGGGNNTGGGSSTENKGGSTSGDENLD